MTCAMSQNLIKIYLRPLGPAMIKGLLKFLFICLRNTWNILEGFVGYTKEKLAVLKSY